MLMNKLALTAMTFLLPGASAANAKYVTHSLNAFARPWESEQPGEPRRDPARTEHSSSRLTSPCRAAY
jgi:hypothetical protein